MRKKILSPASTRLEKQLQEKEKTYQTIFQVTPIPIAVYSYPEKIVLEANEAFSRLAGKPVKDILGKSGMVAYTWADESKRLKYFATLEKKRKVDNLEIKLVAPDGSHRIFNLSSRLIELDGKYRIVFSMQDITERKNSEFNVFRKVMEAEEKERQRFATDLHDDLGPALSILKLQMESMRNQKDPKKILIQRTANIDLLEDVIGRLHSISMNISPHTIRHFGLESAMLDLCQRIREVSGTVIHFSTTIGEARFPEQTEIYLYRILSELLNNSLKYAKKAPISIGLAYRNGEIKMNYADHGTFYDIKQILQHSKGMGLQNLIHRVEHIEGKVKFLKIKGHTEVRISCKAHAL